MIYWISVKDRMPAIDGFLVHAKQVLVACEDGTVFAGQYHMNGCFYPDIKFREIPMANASGWIDGVYSGKSQIAKATHWAEMPAPPITSEAAAE